MDDVGLNSADWILQLKERIASLEAELGDARARIADLVKALELSQRAGKRQAAPFSKNKPKAQRRKNGRKSGPEHGEHGHRPAPDDAEVDECHEAPLPDCCPHCGHDAFEEIETVEQFQEELPRKPVIRKFTIHVGTCGHCRKRVRGRHPLQTSDATGACRSQLGPDAQAAIVYLNKHAGMSYGKILHTFKTLFGIDASRGACAQIVLRAGRKLEPALIEIQEKIRRSDHITPDETGWRIGGRPVWLHAWVGDDGATCYTIDPHRKVDCLERLIGIHWSGVMTHDGCSSYDRFEFASHQQCVDHAMRRAHALAESRLAVRRPDADEFPQAVISLFSQALAMRDRLNDGDLRNADDAVRRFWRQRFALHLTIATDNAKDAFSDDEEIQRFAKHLDNHGPDWFLFLTDPAIPATNHRAEQSLKTPIVNRKVFGGNQTEAGARAQEATSSVLETCKNQVISFVDYVSDSLRGCVASLFV